MRRTEVRRFARTDLDAPKRRVIAIDTRLPAGRATQAVPPPGKVPTRRRSRRAPVPSSRERANVDPSLPDSSDSYAIERLGRDGAEQLVEPRREQRSMAGFTSVASITSCWVSVPCVRKTRLFPSGV
jgi:hypothetical protein